MTNQSIKQTIKQTAKRAYPSFEDPLYPQQWHHDQAGDQKNVHLSLHGAWSRNFTGAGSVVCIIDDGIEYTHPDLADNYRADLSYDFNYGGN